MEGLEKSYLTHVISRLQRRHIRAMGATVAYGVVFLFLFFVAFNNAHCKYASGFLLLIATLVGAWISYSTRPLVVTIEDMDARDISRAWGTIQLATVCAISLVLALFLSSGLLPFEVNGFRAEKVLEDPKVALTLGAVFGLTERTLPNRVVSRASKIVEKRI